MGKRRDYLSGQAPSLVFKNVILTEMEELGLSQWEFARLVGVSKATIWVWLNRPSITPSLDTAISVWRFLGRSLDRDFYELLKGGSVNASAKGLTKKRRGRKKV